MGLYLTGVHFIIMYLTGVHLTGVYLIGVYLTGVDLMGRYLINVHLTGVHLMSMHLTGIHLIGVYLINGDAVVDLSRSKLRWLWGENLGLAMLGPVLQQSRWPTKIDLLHNQLACYL
jgi:uncharacterized protein YjbI with pentapeptide repeats